MLRIDHRGAAYHSVSALGSSIGTAILCSEGAAMVMLQSNVNIGVTVQRGQDAERNVK